MLCMMALYTIADRLKLWHKFPHQPPRHDRHSCHRRKDSCGDSDGYHLVLHRLSYHWLHQVASFISMSLAAAKVTTELIVVCTTAPSPWRRHALHCADTICAPHTICGSGSGTEVVLAWPAFHAPSAPVLSVCSLL